MSDVNLDLREHLKLLQMQLAESKKQIHELDANPPQGARARVGGFTEEGYRLIMGSFAAAQHDGAVEPHLRANEDIAGSGGVEAILLTPATGGFRPLPTPSEGRNRLRVEDIDARRVIDALLKKPDLLDQVLYLAFGRGYVQDALSHIAADKTPIALPWATVYSMVEPDKTWHVRRRLLQVEKHTFQNPLAAEIVNVEGGIAPTEFDWHVYDRKMPDAHPDSTAARVSGTAKDAVQAALAVDDTLRERGWVLL